MHKKSTACSFSGSKVMPVFVEVDFIRLELRFFRTNKKHSLEGELDSHACVIGVVRPKTTLHHIGVTSSNLEETNNKCRNSTDWGGYMLFSGCNIYNNFMLFS